MITNYDVLLSESMARAGVHMLSEQNWRDKAAAALAGAGSATAAAPAATGGGVNPMQYVQALGAAKGVTDQMAGSAAKLGTQSAIDTALANKDKLAKAGSDIASKTTQSAIDTAFGNRGKLTGMAHSTGSATVHGALSALSKPKNLGKLALGGAAVGGGAALAARAANIGKGRSSKSK